MGTANATMTGVILNFGSQPSLWTWLGPVLASIVSLAVSLVALGGVLWSGWRTDLREFKKWRRETIVKLSSDALVEARNVENNYMIATTADTLPYTEELKAAAASARQLNPISDQLRIVSAGGGGPLLGSPRCSASRRSGEPS